MGNVRLQYGRETLDTPSRAALPASIGRFIPLRTLARDREMIVFLASTESGRKSARLVTLKCFADDTNKNPRAVAAFLDRTRLASLLDHPSLLRVVDVGSADGRLFIAFEHVPSVSLARLMSRVLERDERVPTPILMRIAYDLLDALEYSHELCDAVDGRSLDIVHRDVSPESVIIGFDGRGRLDESRLARTRISRVTTETGIVKGRFAYLAPEQAAGDPVDARADLWSLGVVLWEGFAGRSLFGGQTGFASLTSSMVGTIPRLVDVAPVSPVLSAAIERALQRTPDTRHVSAHAMRAAMEASGEPVATHADVGAYVASRFPREVEDEAALAERASSLRAARTTPAASRLHALAMLIIALFVAFTWAVCNTSVSAREGDTLVAPAPR